MDKTTCIAFDNLKGALKKFFDGIKSGKTPSKTSFDATAQMQMMKKQIIEELGEFGFYKRDDGRIVISAPEVIIGNVDKSGVLYAGESSKVTIRANDVSVQCPAVCDSEHLYSGGTFSVTAPVILQDAVNPGIEGEQSVVCDDSKIISRAKSISLNTQNTGDCFLFVPGGEEGISISSHSNISLKSNKIRDVGKLVEEWEKTIAQQIEDMTEVIEAVTKPLDEAVKELHKLQEETAELIGENDFDTSGSISSIDENVEAFESRSKALRNIMSSCESMIRRLAELKRVDKSYKEGSVKAYCDSLPKEEDSSSNGRVSVVSDRIELTAVNGNGEETPSSSVSIGARHVDISTRKNDDKGMKDSSIALHAENVSIDSTAMKEDGSIVAVGGFSVSSKKTSFVASDVSKEGEVTPSEEGGFSIYAKSITAGASDSKEGKVAGSFSVNTKKITFRAVDADLSDKKKIKDKELSAEGKIELFAKNLQIGNIGEDEEKLKTEKITLVGKEVVVDLKKAEDKFDLKQEDAPILDITGSKTTIKSKEGFGIEEGDVTIKTKVTVEAKTEFKDDVKGTKIEAQNLEASAGVKTPKVDK
ncbi:MAG TPA: hypothetical protein DDY68_04925 [Porphyromonadaceae bacterium]|nr:hypothetical protein [Porphyromonadaceae bacterium]